MKIYVSDGDEFNNENEEEFSNFLESEGLVHFLLFAFQPNAFSFVSSLTEKSKREKSKKVWFRNIEWGDYFWYFVSIPIHKIKSAKLIAKEKNLLVLPKIPIIVTKNERLLFPIGNRTNIFTLIYEKPTEN